MLGIWSLGRAPLGFTLHLAFEVLLDDGLHATKRLRTQGIKVLSFFGVETTEPSVICWMPAASVYFRNPDGNLLEYISMLEKEPRLASVSSPTLIISGTDDNNVPSGNSLIIAAKIPGAWLVHIKDAGHALMSQYPDKFNKVLQTFLSTTTNPG